MSGQVGICSIPEAAKFLSISRGKIYLMINSGECPSKRFGKSVRIPWAWLLKQAEVEEQKQAETPAK